MNLTQGEVNAPINELLQAQSHVWNHMLHFIRCMSLKCVVELSIPDIIRNHGGPMTPSELVDMLPVPPVKASHVQRVMQLLVYSGFFALQRNGDGEEGYVLTPSSKLLLKESSMSLSPFVLALLDQKHVSPWQLLSRYFQGKEEETLHEVSFGMSLWKYMAQNPEYGNMFNAAMVSDSRILMKALVEKCGEVFEGVESLVDVGGGTGECAMTIAKAFPQIKCTVLDLPHVVATAPQKAANLKFVGGNMFESIPKAHAIFLKWILHDWGDEECVKILKLCREAIPPKEEGGKVIVVDTVVDTMHGDPKFIETQLCMDVVMMITGGKERNECQWHKIFMNAGFSEYKIVSVLGLRSVIELYP